MFFGRNIGWASRIGLWALFQVLPDDKTLRAYLRAIYFGITAVIAGSVLVGAALSACLIAFYQFLVAQNVSLLGAALAAGALGLVVTITCFGLGIWWFTRLAQLPKKITLPDNAIETYVKSLLASMAEGFLEGFNNPAEKTASEDDRDLRTHDQDTVANTNANGTGNYYSNKETTKPNYY